MKTRNFPERVNARRKAALRRLCARTIIRNPDAAAQEEKALKASIKHSRRNEKSKKFRGAARFVPTAPRAAS